MKKKGFTLIELLAVILILGIIALIAIPMVMNIVEDAKKGAAKVSSENYKRAVENYLMLQEIMGYPVKLENNTTYMVSSSSTMEVSLNSVLFTKVYADVSNDVYLNELINIKGEYPNDGYVTIGNNEVEKVALSISGYVTECDSDTCEVIRKSDAAPETCDYSVGDSWSFDYKEEEETFEVPCSGTYKLEVWGAEGGNVPSGHNGGVGAYARGTISLNSKKTLYINVGGVGVTNTSPVQTDVNYYNNGGYNGGGNNGGKNGFGYGATGGGATHIALVSGLLKNIGYEEFVTNNKGLIVAGGGAGASIETTSGGGYCNGGNAGGISGSKGTTVRGMIGNAGDQTSGYAFGLGISVNGWEATGGGGLYGGYQGSGGSSYIGNPDLNEKIMYCYNCATSTDDSTRTETTTCAELNPTENCAKKGNGFAKITYISK